MKDERDVRLEASECFNHRESFSADSAYMRLTKLMTIEYDLDDYEVEELVGDIEQLVAGYIIKNSPKFTDNEEH